MANPAPKNAAFTHPLEIETSLYQDIDVATDLLHEGIVDWLKRPKQERAILKTFFRLKRVKQAYWNTPKKDRTTFLYEVFG